MPVVPVSGERGLPLTALRLAALHRTGGEGSSRRAWSGARRGDVDADGVVGEDVVAVGS